MSTHQGWELDKEAKLEKTRLKILELRKLGKLTDAIDLCKQGAHSSPTTYFYPKTLSELYFDIGDYESASTALIGFLKNIPPKERLFIYFARRYYRLRRVWSKNLISSYASTIMSELNKGEFDSNISNLCKSLIKSDLPRELEISSEGEVFKKLSINDMYFDEFTNQGKILEAKNPLELEILLDSSILNRKRDRKTFRIDAYCISIYEKMEKYQEAIKISEELLAVRFDSVIVRSFFRICRKMKTYEKAHNLLSKYPRILKSMDFNVLYELVYYFESQNDLDTVQEVLKKIEKRSAQSIPIQKTVRNFYFRFGLLEDALRAVSNISGLFEAAGRKSERFFDEVQESEAEVGSKIKELYSEVEHHKQLAAICDLTTGISHELGQPITNIRYTIQFHKKLLEDKLSRKDVFSVFDSIIEETERMGGLVKRLAPLTSSKSVTEDFDMISRIKKRIDAENARLSRKNIETNISPEDPVYLCGDPIKFDQLISNLMLNAIDAISIKKGSKKKQIIIKVARENKQIKLIFSDTGIGVSAKYRGKIFDPFFTTNAPGKGEGLGLFIVWNIMKIWGGKIALDAKYKNGARFILSFPKP